MASLKTGREYPSQEDVAVARDLLKPSGILSKVCMNLIYKKLFPLNSLLLIIWVTTSSFRPRIGNPMVKAIICLSTNLNVECCVSDVSYGRT